jgi:hypothetical protein
MPANLVRARQRKQRGRSIVVSSGSEREPAIMAPVELGGCTTNAEHRMLTAHFLALKYDPLVNIDHSRRFND